MKPFFTVSKVQFVVNWLCQDLYFDTEVSKTVHWNCKLIKCETCTQLELTTPEKKVFQFICAHFDFMRISVEIERIVNVDMKAVIARQLCRMLLNDCRRRKIVPWNVKMEPDIYLLKKLPVQQLNFFRSIQFNEFETFFVHIYLFVCTIRCRLGGRYYYLH